MPQSMSTAPNAAKNLTTLSKKFFGTTTSWTTFEKAWLAIFGLINVAVFFMSDDTPLGLIASLTGMLSVVMTAKGLLGSYPFGVIQVVIYGWVAYTYGLYGETMLNWLYYLPLQFVGLWLWARKSRNDESDNITKVVIAKKLTIPQFFGVLVAAGIAVVTYASVLSSIGGKEPGLDSVTTVLSVVAMILMLARYREQWGLWIIIDILSVAMWVIVLIKQDGSAWPMVVMWTAFLVNAVYGYWNWNKMVREQDALDKQKAGA